MKRRIYIRIGLGIAAVAVFILPTYFGPSLLSVPALPKFLWHYQSEIGLAYVIVWIVGSAFVANGFFSVCFRRHRMSGIGVLCWQ